MHTSTHFSCLGLQVVLLLVVHLIDIPNLNHDSFFVGLSCSGRSLFVVLVDNSYVVVGFLQIHQPLVNVLLLRCPSSGYSCSTTCSGWAIGADSLAYYVAFVFVFLMHDHGGFASHHLGRCKSERRIHADFDCAVVSPSWIGSSFRATNALIDTTLMGCTEWSSF